MAKLSKIRASASNAEAIAQKEEVRRIRARFAEALRRGFSTEEAAKLAQGDGEIKVNPASAPITQSVTGAPVQTVQLSGRKVSISDVPPNWQDLPWPHLKSLADAINGKDVKARKTANEVIERFLDGETNLKI